MIYECFPALLIYFSTKLFTRLLDFGVQHFESGKLSAVSEQFIKLRQIIFLTLKCIVFWQHIKFYSFKGTVRQFSV